MELRAVLKYLFLNRIRRGFFLFVSPLKAGILMLHLLAKEFFRMLKNLLCEIFFAFLDFSYHEVWQGP